MLLLEFQLLLFYSMATPQEMAGMYKAAIILTPAIQPIFDRLSEEAWKEVTRL